MPITPVEIRHVQLRRGAIGYRRRGVDQLLEQVAGDFEQVWRERADLVDRLEELQAEVDRHRELEALLRSTLVSAERASHDLKEQARREADLTLNEAHAQARSVLREAIAEKQALMRDAHRIRALLRSALDALEQAPAAEDEPAGEASADAGPGIESLAG